MASTSKTIVSLYGAVAIAASGVPSFKPGDRVEFTEYVYAHADKDVRHEATNRLGIIPKGAIATIVRDHRYPPSPPNGKEGDVIYLETEASPTLPKQVWVYFNSKFPWLKKLSDDDSVKQPKLAQNSGHNSKANRKIASDSPIPVAPACAAPNQADQAAEQKPLPDHFGFLSFAPRFSYSKITMVDSNTLAEASLLSGLNYGGILTWGQQWSKTFQTSLNFEFQQETYSSVDSTSLNGASHMMTNFGLDAKDNITGDETHPFTIEFGLHDQQTLFAEALSDTNIQLVTVAIPNVSLGLDYRILATDIFNLDPYVQGTAYFPTSTDGFSVNSGIGYALGLKLSESLTPTMNLNGDAGYAFERQNTSIESMQRTDLYFSLGLSIRLGAFNAK